jgi:hypothetical protein
MATANAFDEPPRRPRRLGDAGRDAVETAVFALALGMFISTREWHHFVTLTVDRGAAPDRLVKLYHSYFIRRLAFAARQRINHFYAVELDRRTGKFAHVHALLHGTAGLTVRDMRRLWPFGFTDLSRYDQRQRGAHYVVKGLLIDPDTYNFSKHLPPAIMPWAGRVEEDFEASVAAMRAAQV